MTADKFSRQWRHLSGTRASGPAVSGSIPGKVELEVDASDEGNVQVGSGGHDKGGGV